jgi:protein-L-isoaspartate(D-aspartate) O-methyltransferase
MPVGGDEISQRLLRVRRRADATLLEEQLEAVAFVPLIGAEGWPERRGKQRSARIRLK